jgi:hypothetical protein
MHASNLRALTGVAAERSILSISSKLDERPRNALRFCPKIAIFPRALRNIKLRDMYFYIRKPFNLKNFVHPAILATDG